MLQSLLIKRILKKNVLIRRLHVEKNIKPSYCYTNKLQFINVHSSKIPVYGGFDDFSMLDNIAELRIDKELLLRMYKNMISLKVMDQILYECQRQGRISFYMTNSGEEALQIGSAAALDNSDLIYAQYREAGVLLWRGYKFDDFVNQCFGNDRDSNKGRQMPVHYGSKDLNFFTISSPLATQLPQAVGSAYCLKDSKSNSCVVCYFGEGAASEGDAHAAFNFAATLSCPVVFICRNNEYAISTPSHQQYAGDGIAARGPAFGISTIRVDGNDIMAMYHATQFARKHAIDEQRPVLVEAMTYRIGHHSTSDDSKTYRTAQEINAYQEVSPLNRLKLILEKHGIWSNEKEENYLKLEKTSILEAISAAEARNCLSPENLFEDVYKTIPRNIARQKQLLQRT